MCTINRRPIYARFHFMDGQFHAIEFDPSATADEVLNLVKAKIGLGEHVQGRWCRCGKESMSEGPSLFLDSMLGPSRMNYALQILWRPDFMIFSAIRLSKDMPCNMHCTRGMISDNDLICLAFTFYWLLLTGSN